MYVSGPVRSAKTYLTSFLQAGIKLHSLHSKEVSHALKKATSDRWVSAARSAVVAINGDTNFLARVMKEKAASVGERIREVRACVDYCEPYLH